MAKWVCPVCGYVHEGDTPPEKCPICNVPGEKFTLAGRGKDLGSRTYSRRRQGFR